MESDRVLDMGYKYPFSSEAKLSISDMKAGSFDIELAKLGKLRVQEALEKSRIDYSPTPFMELKKKYIASYVYARMMVSSLGSKPAVAKYASAEAKRCAQALITDNPRNVTDICAQLGLHVHNADDKYSVGMTEFLSVVPNDETLKLVNQQIQLGKVYLGIERLSRIAEAAISKEIAKGLPIDPKTLPRDAIELAKSIKHSKEEASKSARARPDSERYEWIEALLQNPIEDVRHRTINLILAPYFVNVLNLDQETAAKEIIKYIERCKEINPDTNVDERYIRYQCSYAKKRGLSPLSFTKARDMLSHIVDIKDMPNAQSKRAK